MNRYLWALALTAMTALTGCSGKNVLSQKEVPNVKVQKVETQSVSSRFDYIGTVEESQALSLSFQSVGSVEEVFVNEGDFVRKGQKLAILDKTSLQSIYDAAHSTLLQAEDAYTRMGKLHNNGSIPEIQWVEIESKVQIARSSEQVARKALENAELYAPKEGLISQRNIEPGENAMAGISVFKLVDIDEVYVRIAVPESEISSVHIGDKVEMTVKALDNKTVTGTVTNKDIAASLLSHTYDIKVKTSNRDHAILPGMLCKVSVLEDSSAEQITIPQNAVMLDFDNTRFVWTVSDGKAVKSPVEIGEVNYRGVVIKSGLEVGCQVVVSGMQKISDGMEIKIVK